MMTDTRAIEIIRQHLSHAEEMHRYCTEHQHDARSAAAWAARARECRELLRDLESAKET